MKKIFITGGTGLIGRAILHELSQFSFQITALRRTSSNLHDLPASIHWVEGDLNDIETYLPALIEADVVIHCAALLSFSPKDNKELMRLNIQSTKEIVEACNKHQIRLIHFSSVAALGRSTEGLIDEGTEFSLHEPSTVYARSKYFSELEVWRGIAEGLEAVILNPSIVLGVPSNFSASSGVFWDKINNGMNYYTNGTTGYVDVRDVAIIVRKLVDSNISGQRFILSNENLNYKEFLTKIASQLQKKAPKYQIPLWLGEIMWRVNSVLTLLQIPTVYTKGLHETIHSRNDFDSRKVQNELNIQFRPIDETIKWVSDAFTSTQE